MDKMSIFPHNIFSITIIPSHSSWSFDVLKRYYYYSPRIEHLSFCCWSVAKSRLTLSNSMDCSTPGVPVLHNLLEFAQTCVHWVHDAIQPTHHPLSPSSPPALNLSQHNGLFQWVGSSHHVVKVLELQHQHQPFQWIFRVKMNYNSEGT